MPVNAAGIRKDPAMSEPRPMTDPAEANKAACKEEQKIYYLTTISHGRAA